MRGQEHYQQEHNNSLTVPGYMRLADFRTLTNFDIDDPLMNTIGGVALVLFGRLPRVGEKIFSADYELTVKEVSGMRITKVRVSFGRTQEEDGGSAPAEPLDMESPAESTSDESPADQEQESLDEYEDELLREAREEEAESSGAQATDGDQSVDKTAAADNQARR